MHALAKPNPRGSIAQKSAASGGHWMAPGSKAHVPVDQLRQKINSVAHNHGVVLIRNGQAVAEIPAGEFCCLVRDAYTAAGPRRDQVNAVIRSVAGGIKQTPGPLPVSASALNILKGFARGRQAQGQEEAQSLRVVRPRRRGDDRGSPDPEVGAPAAVPAHPGLRSRQGAGVPKVQRGQGADAAGDVRGAASRRAGRGALAQGLEPTDARARTAAKPKGRGLHHQPHAGAGAALPGAAARDASAAVTRDAHGKTAAGRGVGARR